MARQPERKNEIEEIVDYCSRYGGFCRDCADHDGVCPNGGGSCNPKVEKAAMRKGFAALLYGLEHGYIKNSPFALHTKNTPTPKRKG